jgi:hypothetical protein
LSSGDCGRAGLVDEWLQVRNALSIEIFSQDHPLPSFTPSSAPEGFVNCVIGGIEPSLSSVRLSAFVDRANDRHPAIDARGHARRADLALIP